jgi:hypothetical protein
MSTQKQLAKVVRLDWRKHPNHKGPFYWYETQDGRKFRWVDFRPSEWPDDAKVYVVKKLNVIRANQWAYEVYEVPKQNLIDLKYKDNWKWLEKQRGMVYEVKK